MSIAIPHPAVCLLASSAEPLVRRFDFFEHLIEPWTRNVEFTGWIVAMGVFVAVPCAVLGCFLVLRGKALLGDAISHALLAGLAGAFLVTGSRGAVAMIAGAVAAGLLTVVLIELIHRRTRVKEDASIAVVFSTLFALGVVLITRFTEGVDLDAHCVLYGEIEMSWLRPDRVKTMGGVAVAVVVAAVLFFKELKITSFDAATATALGIPAAAVHYALMAAVSVTVVSGMEAVGAILVVAMLIAPGATAYLLTDRLARMVLLAAGLGAVSAVVGFHVALWLDCSTAGAIAVVSFGMFLVTWLASPRHGVLLRVLRRWQLATRIARENFLRAAFNLRPSPAPEAVVGASVLGEQLRMLPADLRKYCRRLQRDGWIECDPEDQVRLTDKGFRQARRIVRAHRLWETYLVNQVGIALDHAHPDAEEIEHLLSERLLDRVDDLLGHPVHDPHGKRIPRPPELLAAGAETHLARLREGDVALIRGIDGSATGEVLSRIAALALPLGAEIQVVGQSGEVDWTIRCPDGTQRRVDHPLADAIRVEIRRPVLRA
ncbi:MAG: metal ABC transporter permease [Planctomycetes bacterium]|nr:metal ABC transporter permease [Planctomycetota bacterium]